MNQSRDLSEFELIGRREGSIKKRGITPLPTCGPPTFMAPRLHGRVHNGCDSQWMIPWMEPLTVERGTNFKEMILLAHRMLQSLQWPPTEAFLRTCAGASLRAFAACRVTRRAKNGLELCNASSYEGSVRPSSSKEP